jgi:hypothetical protein
MPLVLTDDPDGFDKKFNGNLKYPKLVSTSYGLRVSPLICMRFNYPDLYLRTHDKLISDGP